MTQPPWTYSQLDSFESCPKKFYHLKVVRDTPDPPGEAAEWGKRVHSAFEDAVKIGAPLPEGMTHWQPLADKLTALPGEKLPEYKFAIDRNFQPTDWSNSWSRGIADLVVLSGQSAAVLDYKTGKRKPSEQLDLYAAYVFHAYPEVQKVTVGYVWLKERRVEKKPIARTDLSAIWDALLPRVAKLTNAFKIDNWPARPSGLCRGWCPVHTCEFNNKKGR